MSDPLPTTRAAMTRRAVLRTSLGGLAGAALPASAALAAPSDAEIAEALRSLLFFGEGNPLEGISLLQEYRNPDVAASLILALRFSRQPRGLLEDLLRATTGEEAPQGWFQWMLWQEAHPEVIPHPSYPDLKREMFLSIDENFAVFLKPEHIQRERMKIRLEEITWGGVRKDGIPSLDFPTMIEADEADYLVEDDLVFGVAINGDVRAYPLRIMGWHEMFNDVIGGVPLALAYCTLCGSGILFETEVPGRLNPFIFGSSGFLYRSNKLMFDRETHSLWNQFTGKPVSGELVDSGLELTQRPVAIETWSRWRARNPGTTVLSLDTGHRRDYGSGVVYSEYFSSPDLMFPTAVDETRLQQKDYVFGVRVFGGAKAWPISAFDGGRVINDELAGQGLVLIGDAAERTVRAYERTDRTFRAGAAAEELIADGPDGEEIWRVREEYIVGPNGMKGPRIAGHIAYWFAWNGYLGAESEYFEG